MKSTLELPKRWLRSTEYYILIWKKQENIFMHARPSPLPRLLLTLQKIWIARTLIHLGNLQQRAFSISLKISWDFYNQLVSFAYKKAGGAGARSNCFKMLGKTTVEDNTLHPRLVRCICRVWLPPFREGLTSCITGNSNKLAVPTGIYRRSPIPCTCRHPNNSRIWNAWYFQLWDISDDGSLLKFF